MPIQPVFLVIDALLYLLVAVGGVFAYYASRHEHLRLPWRQVRRRPLAMAALVVLTAYILIGLLDSMHFRLRLPEQNSEQSSETIYSPQVYSVLDLILEPLHQRSEKTYSAPFATHAHTKEFIEHNGGNRVFDYPRLQHGGAHLEDPDDRAADIAVRLLQSALAGIIAFALLCLATVLLWLRRDGESFLNALRRLLRGDTVAPWRTILMTEAVLILALSAVLHLAPYYHVLGTGQVGTDVLLKSIKSIRTGLVIGTLATLVMLPFAVLFGVMAGYFRGWVDDIIQYFYTTLSSIPGVLLIAAAILSLDVYMSTDVERTLIERQDLRLMWLCLILGVTSWTGLCRLLRGETLKLREVDYIQAATALGVGHARIMMRHVLPNVMHIVLIAIVLDFSSLVLVEAVLSYIGIGVDPSMDSWGNMINGARLEMAREPLVWWTLAAAFVFMFTLVLAANLFSDAVRDAFDPRLRQ